MSSICAVAWAAAPRHLRSWCFAAIKRLAAQPIATVPSLPIRHLFSALLQQPEGLRQLPRHEDVTQLQPREGVNALPPRRLLHSLQPTELRVQQAASF